MSQYIISKLKVELLEVDYAYLVDLFRGHPRNEVIGRAGVESITEAKIKEKIDLDVF